MKKIVERKRLEKAYNIIESTLFEPMIVEIREEKEGRQQQDSSQENAENQSQIEKKRLFRVRSKSSVITNVVKPSSKSLIQIF